MHPHSWEGETNFYNSHHRKFTKQVALGQCQKPVGHSLHQGDFRPKGFSLLFSALKLGWPKEPEHSHSQEERQYPTPENIHSFLSSPDLYHNEDVVSPDQVLTDLLQEGGRSREGQSPHGWVVHPKPKRCPAEMYPATAATALPVPHKNQLLWAVLPKANPLLCTALTKPLPPPRVAWARDLVILLSASAGRSYIQENNKHKNSLPDQVRTEEEYIKIE